MMRDEILSSLLAAMRSRTGAPPMPDSMAVKWSPTVEDIADALGPLLASAPSSRAATETVSSPSAEPGRIICGLCNAPQPPNSEMRLACVSCVTAAPAPSVVTPRPAANVGGHREPQDAAEADVAVLDALRADVAGMLASVGYRRGDHPSLLVGPDGEEVGFPLALERVGEMLRWYVSALPPLPTNASALDFDGLRAVISSEPSGSQRVVAVPVGVVNQLVAELLMQSLKARMPEVGSAQGVLATVDARTFPDANGRPRVVDTINLPVGAPEHVTIAVLAQGSDVARAAVAITRVKALLNDSCKTRSSVVSAGTILAVVGE